MKYAWTSLPPPPLVVRRLEHEGTPMSSSALGTTFGIYEHWQRCNCFFYFVGESLVHLVSHKLRIPILPLSGVCREIKSGM